MVAPASYTTPDAAPAARTVDDARKERSSSLLLSGARLLDLPPGLKHLLHLRSLNVSENFLEELVAEQLPHGLVEVTATGCRLSAVTPALAGLPALERVFLGANRLSSVDVVFRCPRLQHVGLSYNRLSCLPPATLLSYCPLLSIDLAHNDLADRDGTLLALCALPALCSLHLGGNPLCLIPGYAMAVLLALPRLTFLDGQKLTTDSSSRPSSRTPSSAASGQVLRPAVGGAAILAAASAALAAAGSRRSPGSPPRFTNGIGGFGDGSTGTTGGATEGSWLDLELDDIGPVVDPWEGTKQRWAGLLENAMATGVPPDFSEKPPLQPVIYYVELADCEGETVASVPLIMSPPEPPLYEPVDPKAAKKEAVATKKAPSAKGKKGGGKNSAKAAALAAAGALDAAALAALDVPLKLGGRLRLIVPLSADIGGRDFLRNGIRVRMYCVRPQATLRPVVAPAFEPPSATRAPASPPIRAKKAAEVVVIPDLWDISGEAALLGEGLISGMGLLDGTTPSITAPVPFIPLPELWDESTGVRLALKDARHVRTSVASLQATLTLHATRPPPRVVVPKAVPVPVVPPP